MPRRINNALAAIALLEEVIACSRGNRFLLAKSFSHSCAAFKLFSTESRNLKAARSPNMFPRR